MHDRSGRVAGATTGRADGPTGGGSGGAAAFVDREPLGAGAVVLRRFAAAVDRALWEQVQRIEAVAPFRHMETPGGFAMAVAMTNCGALGWVTDRRGYRYDPHDPLGGRPWPPMPTAFRSLATEAAAAAGFDRFEPDACLINRYAPRARLSLHRDADERDFAQPIVSVSLGLPATFLFGGLKRSDPSLRVPLCTSP